MIIVEKSFHLLIKSFYSIRKSMKKFYDSFSKKIGWRPKQTTVSCGIPRRRRTNSIGVYTVLTRCYFNPIKSDKTARQERWRTGTARHSYATLRYFSFFFFLVQHSADLIPCSWFVRLCICVCVVVGYTRI